MATRKHQGVCRFEEVEWKSKVAYQLYDERAIGRNNSLLRLPYLILRAQQRGVDAVLCRQFEGDRQNQYIYGPTLRINARLDD